MTLDQWMNCNAAKLEAMSDGKLLEHFEQYLNVTRPDRARTNKPKSQQEPVPYMSPGKRKVLEGLRSVGIDTDEFTKRRKR